MLGCGYPDIVKHLRVLRINPRYLKSRLDLEIEMFESAKNFVIFMTFFACFLMALNVIIPAYVVADAHEMIKVAKRMRPKKRRINEVIKNFQMGSPFPTMKWM